MNPLLTVVLAVLLGACSLLEPGPENAPPLTAAPPTATAATTTAAPASGAAPSRTLTPAVAPETLAPNANLFIQGIPPVPMSLVQNVAPYTEFRGHSFVDWHPTKREMLVSHRKVDGQTCSCFA